MLSLAPAHLLLLALGRPIVLAVAALAVVYSTDIGAEKGDLGWERACGQSIGCVEEGVVWIEEGVARIEEGVLRTVVTVGWEVLVSLAVGVGVEVGVEVGVRVNVGVLVKVDVLVDMGVENNYVELAGIVVIVRGHAH